MTIVPVFHAGFMGPDFSKEQEHKGRLRQVTSLTSNLGVCRRVGVEKHRRQGPCGETHQAPVTT